MFLAQFLQRFELRHPVRRHGPIAAREPLDERSENFLIGFRKVLNIDLNRVIDYA